MGKLFLSHRLDLLAEHLADQLADDGRGILAPRIIVVPNSSLKTWLLIQIAHRSKQKGVAGCRAISLREAVQTYLAPAGFTQIFCSLFSALTDCNDPQIFSYLAQSPRKKVELADRLANQFIRYGNFCPSLFQPNPKVDHWQKELIQKLFVLGPLKLPVQMAPPSLPPLHCFGFDYLPPTLWRVFNFSSIYLFSPCFHYWDDLCTDRERKTIGRYWKRKGASEDKREELEEYLKEVPPLLANWGRAGRETLKILDGAEIEEDYRLLETESNSTLTRLRRRLLEFSSEIGEFPQDDSVQISKTGSSLLAEIDYLRIAILRLMEKEKLQYSDIAVFAPDIKPYASLIQFAFSDLPFKISGLEIGSKSFFYQAMHRLFELDGDSEDLMALFENPSFSRARSWTSEILEQIRGWVSNAADLETRLLDQFIYLFPEEKKRISTSAADALEQLIETSQSLRADGASLKESRTLSDWANLLFSLIQKYLLVDLTDEADAAAWGFFKQTLRELKQSDSGHLFPFAPIQSLLKGSIPGGQIHASHLHAIQFSSLREGALTPVRALFLIGMDEENFPRRSISSSIDLMRDEKIYLFEQDDQDRYLFLQVLFAAQDFLQISYSHLSSEGNPKNPSPFIGELSRSLDAPMKENRVQRPLLKSGAKPLFLWPEIPSFALPEGERTVSLSDLVSLARHPWEFYLQKQLGIRFEKDEEFSFSRQRAKILKAQLQKPLEELLFDLPIGMCGEALKMELADTSKEWDACLRSWDLKVESLSFRMSCREKRRTESGWEYPALELDLGSNLHVKLTGEVKTFSSKGFVLTGSDGLEGILRVWPECLAALIASQSREIYCLKSGKPKTVENPEEALKAFLRYYFIAQSAPSPLLSDWADPLLRKGPNELEKKMSGQKKQFEDPMSDWVLDRISLPNASACFEQWGELLRTSFKELTALFPARGKHASV